MERIKRPSAIPGITALVSMDVSAISIPQLPPPRQTRSEFEPDFEKIKQRLLKNGVYPTPKILRNLRKKEIQKHNRRAKRELEESRAASSSSPPLTESQRQALAEEASFQALRREYKRFTRKIAGDGGSMVGKPWEGIERVWLKELARGGGEETGGGKLRRENLKDLRDVLEHDLRWVLEDDIDLEEFNWLENEKRESEPAKRWLNEGEAIKVLVDRLSSREITENHWKFVRILKQSGLQFTEKQLLEIVKKLGDKGSTKQALAVVQWVYADKRRKQLKSRFVYTKLLSILGEARMPEEALRIFNLMLGDREIYPDMAAYHSIAVTLGKAGLLKELLRVIECMRKKPSKAIKNLRQKNWDPALEPDLVVYNAVMNACVSSRQWKGAFWVFEQLRKSGLRPSGATYGLAMEVMLESGKYELVHEFFRKMKGRGDAPKAITYKVLVRALGKEAKIDEAAQMVREMEQRGIVGTASVYYELACCLCYNGRWQEAVQEVEKMKKLPNQKPLEVTYTGLIMSSMDGGHISNCVAIFHHMRGRYRPNIGTVNAMLKVYGKNDMFSEAKELFEEIKGGDSLLPDMYTYSSMLEASARALQWEYFEYVYKDTYLSGFHLYQAKHASLLVEASRAGKGHLLEHTFYTLLEAGEIPHLELLTEMVSHATSQEDYEKATALVNIVALASVQVTERQWTDLFVKNRHALGQENLQFLLDSVHDCGLSSEPTVTNLSKSLSSLCRSTSSSDPINPAVKTDVVNTQIRARLSNNGRNKDRISELFADGDSGDESVDSVKNELAGFNSDEEDGELNASASPSAFEILKEWEESRRKDGIFSLF